MNHPSIKFLIVFFFAAACFCSGFPVLAQNKDTTLSSTKKDSAAFAKQDTLRFPINDRRGDRFSWQNKNSFDLNDTALIKQNVTYDPKTNQYYIDEKIGNTTYRKPTFLTFEEYYALQNKKYEANYFKQRADALSKLNQKIERPKMRVYDKLFDRIFGLGGMPNVPKVPGGLPGSMKIDIKPAGTLDVTMGYQGQITKNPTLPERARKTGGLDFNMNANLNVNANIGDKLKLPINYNTLANFDYLNQIKLDYKGMDDEILKSFEAGNISFQTKSSLIPSSQNLFGLKTQLQFGRLFITAALANQKSQRQNQALQGGAALTNIKKKLDEYDENRHFLLAQYFKNNYNKNMSNLPAVTSQVQIQRIEVWITNKTGATTDTRDVVGLMDLGESSPYNTAYVHSNTSNQYPDNSNNDLYLSLAGSNGNRNPSTVTNTLLNSKHLTQINDFEKTFARKLTTNEYYFNPQIGFLSINTQLQPDDVLAVAYQYTANGKVYQVGEFSQDVGLDSTQGVQKVLFLKLLKATSARTNLPIWGLMMKNVYSLDMAGITRDGFQLNILYQQPSGGNNRYLPESDAAVNGQSLLKILKLDRLNSRNDPQPDGIFDYIEGYTILSQQGKIIFPVLEPFGKDLEALAFNSPAAQSIKSKYLFPQLYDTIKAIAQTYANLDRFLMQGQAKGTGGTEIYLGAFNIPQGSVKITAGGQTLVEGTDYIIDYNLGSVKVINQSIINSGIPVNVSYENNGSVGTTQRGFLGLRLDYVASKKFSIGATYERLNERPYFTKMNYGEDPIRNSMYGLDFNYKSSLPSLTRLLNKLPFYSTKAPSSITAYGEGAYFKPGHPSQIGKGNSGVIYVDDFEGSTSNLDLRFPFTSWALASTPKGNLATAKFPEATLSDNLTYGKRRAKLAWYNIEPTMQDKNSTYNPLKGNTAELSDPRVRQVYTNELFPQQSTTITNTQTTTFDLAYYPKDPGPYNYETDPSKIDGNGKFTNPSDKWGGIMRAIDQTDFETNNFEFIEFWVQDPFIKTPNSTGGKLFINLGSISEDILKDGKRFYENGMNTPNSPAAIDTSIWGRSPLNPVQVTNAFSNDPNDRPYQDVGFDGLNDDSERVKRRVDYLTPLANNFGANSLIAQRANADPSNDNYIWYRDTRYDAAKTGILGRYKNYNNPQGNSPISSGSTSPAATVYPDNEDLNKDNTLNETEEYYEYEVDLGTNMNVGTTKYVTDKRSVTVKYADGHSGTENWYLFRVPIKEYSEKVGQIPDFKSIRFMRMFLTGFQDSTVLRFASLNLVRNQWRQFAYKLDTVGAYTTIASTNSTTTFNTLAVNLEANSNRTPVNYRIPPGIQRVQTLSTTGVSLLQNEQAMSLQLYNLAAGDARAVFKTTNIDLRNYGKLSMFAHAENTIQTPNLVSDNDLNLVVRIGQDFLNNYYEIKIPLKLTLPGNYSDAQAIKIWPAENNLDFSLQDLVKLKLRRNNIRTTLDSIYRERIGGKVYSVLGNPNLGEISGMLIGVENASGKTVSAEVWVNELRLSEINEHGAYSALGKVDITLADLGKLTLSASAYSQGWGTLESHITERAKDNMFQYNAAINIEAGKLLPKQANLSIPVYASINKTVHTPQFDPYDLDVKLSDKLSAAKGKSQRDSIRNAAIDQTTIKTLNFTNVHFIPKGKPHLLSPSNFDVSYSLTQTVQSSPTILNNTTNKWRVGLGYTFNNPSKYIEPFKRVIKTKSKWVTLIKDFNFNYKPSLLSFRSDINRQFGRYIPRVVNTDLTHYKVERVDTTYDKYFTFDRFYNLRWDLTRSINLDFSATNNAKVDEPIGALNTQAKRDSVKRNFLKGGRNVAYNQKASASYTFPLSKLPLTDWITARYTYATSYNWVAASLLAISQGNTIENSQSNIINGEFDFTRLYAKSKLLNALSIVPPSRNTQNRNPSGKINNPVVLPPPQQNKGLGIVIPPKSEVVNGLTGKKRAEALAKWYKLRKDQRIALRLQRANQPIVLNTVERTAGGFLTMLKRISVNYSENYKSRLPGYMDSTYILGQNWKSMQPGLDYVFGKQPDTSWLNKKAAQGVLTKDSTFNYLFRQNFEQKLSITAQLEPIRELKIDINFEKSFSKEYSELFKDTSNIGKARQHLNPYASGGFSVSFIAINTIFNKTNPNEVSATFRKFEANRSEVSKRIAQQNPYWLQDPKFTNDGYADGYGRYSQNVLIPAFIAAYTGKSAKDVPLIKESNGNIKLNPFSGILPKPNWRISYTGLTKIPLLAKIFSSINLSHAYTGNLNMNSYTSALNFTDQNRYGAPGFYDSINHKYIPFFLVPNITIQEQFSPLFGIDVTTTKQLSLKFEYKKARIMSLSLIDYQLTETRSTEWAVGGSYRKRGIKLPFKVPFTQGKKLQNDLTFKLDVAVRDDATSNSRLDQTTAYGTGGQKVITIQPSIDYVLNNRLNLKLFFDQRRTTPYISTSPPTITTRAGLQIRVSLSP